MHIRLFQRLSAILLMAYSGLAIGQSDTEGKITTASKALLAPWVSPFGGVPRWDLGSPARYKDAIGIALAERRAEYAAIARKKASPTFENTFVPFERAGGSYTRVTRMFDVMVDNVGTPEYQALNREVAPKRAAAADEIFFNEALFDRIRTIYQARAKSRLSPEQIRLIERIYDTFVRSGAKLNAADKARLSQINQQLASLFAEFSEKLLADDSSSVVLDSEADLVGLPDSFIGSASAEATDRKLDGKWVIVNTRSSVEPFLAFSTRRELREKVWRMFINRGDNGDANDTNETIRRIVRLRAERAQLLGYPSHAHWRMADTMVKDPLKAQALMMRVWPAAVARVREEVADMQAIANQEGAAFSIEPWDYRFYTEKVRKARYDVDQTQIKPYFELNKMIQAAFWSAGQLYGITFTEISGQVPVFHPDVRVWVVKNKATGRHVGLFYGDYYARLGKRSGAWASDYRIRQRFDVDVSPIASNNNNFVRGAPAEAVLISLDDVRTLFHEFGHALHSLLSEVTYPDLDVTPRDYVEYPAQVNERWMLTRQVLNRFARNSDTGEPLPESVMFKVKASEKFNQGFAVVEYLATAILDIDLHTRPDGNIDPDAFERENLQRIGMPKEIVLRHRLPQFEHAFGSDAYSAGYYSYLWSSVMDADTWKAFQEAGDPFDPATATRLRELILAPGNSTDRAQAFRAFRGHDPDVNAYLEDHGFPTGPP